MNGFGLAPVPEIVAGVGRVASIGGDVARLAGERVPILLVCDPALGELGATARVADALAAGGHTIQRFDDIMSGPREAQVSSGARLCREMGARAVVGLGGGSALDVAKMIAVLGTEEANVADFRLSAKALPPRSLPLLCAPTTAGSGSEVNTTAVLSAEDGTKFWYWSGALKPDFVILDPELTTTLPAHLMAATGINALVNAMEAASNRNATAANDLHSLEAIRLVVRHLPLAVAGPGDLEARQAMLVAASFAGIAADNAGTAIAHCISNALGSLMPIHHGRALAIAMAGTLDWVIEGNTEGFSRIAEAFGLGADQSRLPGEFRSLLEKLRLDTTLPQPLDPGALAAQMAQPENGATRAATARIVSEEDLPVLAERVVSFADGRSKAA